MVLEELHPAWFYLAQELDPGDSRPLYLRRYVTYKAVAEAARAALVAQGEDPALSREAALARACREYPELSQELEAAARLRRNCSPRLPWPRTLLLRAYQGLACTSSEGLAPGVVSPAAVTHPGVAPGDPGEMPAPGRGEGNQPGLCGH